MRVCYTPDYYVVVRWFIEKQMSYLLRLIPQSLMWRLISGKVVLGPAGVSYVI